MKKFVQRFVQVVAVGALGGLVAAWFRGRTDPLEGLPPLGDAVWPPLEPSDAAAPAAQPTGPGSMPATKQAANSSEAPATWVTPNEDGTCPLSHPVKGKERSGIYHVPEGLSYERTNADRCYASPEAAEADGYRASKM